MDFYEVDVVRNTDTKEREQEILGCVIESYVKESKPISSSYLCEKYHLPYSPATVRNVMVDLERKGLLVHVHTSSGRVPTQEGFKQYVGNLIDKKPVPQQEVQLERKGHVDHGLDELMGYALDVLSSNTGYTSMVAISDGAEGEHKLMVKGARYILQQPEFENVQRLRNLFYTLEVRMAELEALLMRCMDQHLQFLIGNEIGFAEIAECSLVVSGTREKDVAFSLGLLGPMRMDYMKAAALLSSVNSQLKEIVDEML